MTKRKLTEKEAALVKKWKNGLGFTAQVASTVYSQGCISEKQSAVLLRDGAVYVKGKRWVCDPDDCIEDDYYNGAYQT